VAISALLVQSTFSATYDASVRASIQFPDPVPNVVDVLGSEFTLVTDYLLPTELAGNAGFTAFAATQSFQSGLLEVGITGPAGFAHPFGKSAAQAWEQTPHVSLLNLTAAPLPLTLRVEYSYALSVSAAPRETANASILIYLAPGEQDASALMYLERKVSFNGTKQETGFVDVPIVLGALKGPQFARGVITTGAATSVPEPASTLVVGTALLALVLLIRIMPARR
jgi:hypothetical protein